MLMAELHALAFLSPILIAAAYTDLRYLKIPNALVLAGLALFVLTLPMLTLHELGLRLLVAGLVFAFTFAGFCFRLLGGGDVKLLALVMLFIPTASLTAFAYTLSAALGLSVMIALSLQNSPRLQKAGWLIAKADGVLPVGVSIAIAGIALPFVTLVLS